MKVLLFNTLSAVNGGTERMVYDTSVELTARGHEVSLVVAYDDRRGKQPVRWPAQINRYYIPELIRPVTDRGSYDSYRKSATYRDGLRYAQDVIDIEAPEIIHVHNFPSVEVFDDLKVRVPMVRTIHSYDNVCRNKVKRLPDGSLCSNKLGPVCGEACGFADDFAAVRQRAENRFMKKNFRRLFAVSGYLRNVLLENGFGRDHVRVLPNFTRLDDAPTGVSDENLVLFVGRMTPEKGLLELVRAVGMTRSNPTLLAVGTDDVLWNTSYRGAVLAEAKRWGVRLETQAWSTGENLLSAYRRARVVAFSSMWPEPFGLVGIEAMMQQRPVVAFDTGGVSDWLANGRTGYTVPAGEVETFSRVLDLLLVDRRMCRDMGHRARNRARDRFSASAHVGNLLNLYDEVLNESSADRSRRSATLRRAQCGTGVPV